MVDRDMTWQELHWTFDYYRIENIRNYGWTYRELEKGMEEVEVC